MQKQLHPDDRTRDDVLDGSDNIESEAGTTDDESESLSDIDDLEVGCYLHNEKEKAFKKIIWEEMNKEYLEEQAAKEVVAANSITKTSAKSRKERRQKCVKDQKSDPAQSPLESSTRMPKRKSSRINYEALEALYSADQGSAKKQKVESDDAVGPVDVDDETVDPGDTEDDGEETRAFEDDNYVGYEDDAYEDYSYDDFDFS